MRGYRNLGVLDALNKIAPVYGVRGIMTGDGYRPSHDSNGRSDKLIYVIHNIAMLDIDQSGSGRNNIRSFTYPQEGLQGRDHILLSRKCRP